MAAYRAPEQHRFTGVWVAGEEQHMDGPDALEQSCARLERLAASAEVTMRDLRVKAALRIAAVLSMVITAVLGCVVALALTWDGPYRLTTAMLLWGAFAVGTLYLRARLDREESEHRKAPRTRAGHVRWSPQPREARPVAR
jgi:hypothetical protein